MDAEFPLHVPVSAESAACAEALAHKNRVSTEEYFSEVLIKALDEKASVVYAETTTTYVRIVRRRRSSVSLISEAPKIDNYPFEGDLAYGWASQMISRPRITLKLSKSKPCRAAVAEDNEECWKKPSELVLGGSYWQ